jgi:hypothetical protein
MYRNILLAVTVCAMTLPAQAQEIFGLAGALEHDSQHTFTLEGEYQQRFGDVLGISAAWINEGHLTGNHRDGPAAQVWLRTNAIDPALTLAAGIGPYAYFDTVPTANFDGSRDEHGIGIIASVAASWNFDGPWSLQFRVNHVATNRSVDTTSVLLGLGYRFDDVDATSHDGSAPAPQELEHEVAVLLGKTIVDDLNAEHSFSEQIEYRQALGPNFAWSVGGLNEGDANTQRRSGVIAQVWIGRTFVNEKWSAAIGFGPYFILDVDNNSQLVEDSRERLAGIFSVTAAYAPVPNWDVRFSVSRVFADNSHDSDVLVLGAGYRF